MDALAASWIVVDLISSVKSDSSMFSDCQCYYGQIQFHLPSFSVGKVTSNTCVDSDALNVKDFILWK